MWTQTASKPQAATACARDDDSVSGTVPELRDLRFRALLSTTQWEALPAAVRRRFSKRLANGATAIYAGEVTEAWTSRAGWILVHLLRLIGGPLPTSRDTGVPSVVTVTEDHASGGQTWTRLYVRRRGFPQVIHSNKRFAGPTGLEEHVGWGIGMTLRVSVEDRALVFRSGSYFVQLLGWRLNLPNWATPGALTVKHIEAKDGHFFFTLDIMHPRLGPLVRQSALFEDAGPNH